MVKNDTGGEQITEVTGKESTQRGHLEGSKTQFQNSEHCRGELIVSRFPCSCVIVLRKEVYVDKLDML